jgi:hypothetical protein
VSGVLQRRCACGTHSVAGGDCESCKKERAGINLQRAAINTERVNEVPPLVHEVSRSSGRPLDTATRAFMEPRFGHDFSGVRVHTDTKAAESARAVNALAYTVGSHLVFSTGQYAPHITAGRQLLAHELTHVVQQSGQLQRSSIVAVPEIKMEAKADRLEREAHEAAEKVAKDDKLPVLQRTTETRLQRAPADAGVPDTGPKTIPKDRPPGPEKDKPAGSEEKDKKLQECIKKGGPDPEACVPTTALTWADFTGTPPPINPKDSAPLMAMTTPPIFKAPVPTIMCLRDVTGAETGPTWQYQARFEPENSWVRSEFKFAGDISKNGCMGIVQACRKQFHEVGRGISMKTDPDPKCPAAVTARGSQAVTEGQCLTVVGVDCTNRMQANSNRLLKHEQQHFNISCAIAKKANAAIAAGGDVAKIDQAVNGKWRPTQVLYDSESQIGCNAAKQTSWEKDIADGLRNVTIP